jgi:hypothetical protein
LKYLETFASFAGILTEGAAHNYNQDPWIAPARLRDFFFRVSPENTGPARSVAAEKLP